MIGAIIGDVVGSVYEGRKCKEKNFPLFSNDSTFTDDTVMTCAIANALLECDGEWEKLPRKAISNMRKLGKRHITRGFGGMFFDWLVAKKPLPYGSFGNGSAMRVSPCGYVAKSVEEAKLLSKLVTEVTHDHPEGVKGAEAIAVAVYMARNGATKYEIGSVMGSYYDINFTLDQIRPAYKFDATCQGSVPQAIVAFLEGESFEDAIRNAISIGGDSDTIAAMAGSIAAAYYDVDGEIAWKALGHLTVDLIEIFLRFDEKYHL